MHSKRKKYKGPGGINPIKLGPHQSDKYIEYRSKILRVKWHEDGIMGKVLLDDLHQRILKDNDLKNRERAKLQQEIVAARAMLHFLPNPKYRYDPRVMVWTPNKKEILKAYGKKNSRILEKIKRLFGLV